MEVITGLLGTLGGKIALALGGVGLAALFPLAKKQIGKLVSSFAAKNLGKMLDPDSKDEREKELIRGVVLAMVRLAEYKIPDRGAGREKYRAVAATLVKVMPFLSKHEGRLADLIEEAVTRMDDELKKASEDGK